MEPVSGWRKITATAWGQPRDPQVYGDLELDAAAVLAYIEQVRREAGVRLTVTHLVGKAVAHALATCPDVNGVLRHGRFVPRDQVDVFFIATIGRGSDLSGVKIEHADRKSAVEIGQELNTRLRTIAEGQDPELGRTRTLLTRAPLPLLRTALRLRTCLTTNHDRSLPRFGLPQQPFGSAMVSSVGMFGIRHAYAPLAAWYRVPLLVLVGEISQRPVAINGTVVVRPVLPLTATLDQRYVDVSHAARLAEAVRAHCHDPAAYEPAPSAAVPAISDDET